MADFNFEEYSDVFEDTQEPIDFEALSDIFEDTGVPTEEMAFESAMKSRETSTATRSLTKEERATKFPPVVQETIATEDSKGSEVGVMVKPVQSNTETRTLTGMEKRYFSDNLPSWQKAQGLPIYRRGRYHKPTLIQSIDKAVSTGEEASLLKGAIKSEIGINAPSDERKYTYRGAAASSAIWKARMDAEGLGTNSTGEEIFNAVYANGNGNGDYASGDGNKYKGRGLVQITGRGNYQAVQDKLAETGLNIDIIANPSLVNDEKYALPAALAMLDIIGINSSSASTMTAKTLNNAINSRADSTKAKARWANVIAAASTAEKDELRLRNDYAAQEEVGLSGNKVDGDIGVGTKAAIDTWAAGKGLTVPTVTQITKIRNSDNKSYQTFSAEDKLKLTKFVNGNK